MVHPSGIVTGGAASVTGGRGRACLPERPSLRVPLSLTSLGCSLPLCLMGGTPTQGCSESQCKDLHSWCSQTPGKGGGPRPPRGALPEPPLPPKAIRSLPLSDLLVCPVHSSFTQPHLVAWDTFPMTSLGPAFRASSYPCKPQRSARKHFPLPAACTVVCPAGGPATHSAPPPTHTLGRGPGRWPLLNKFPLTDKPPGGG